MRPNFIDFVKTNKHVLFDGGMGSMLIEQGMMADDVPELWNVEKSEIVQAIHKQYFNAGANAVFKLPPVGWGLTIITRIPSH